MMEGATIGNFSVAKSFLRCVNHVEEAIFILFPLEEFSHSHGDAGHAALIDQEEEGLIWIQLHAPPDYVCHAN